jgi:hypothetical protein
VLVILNARITSFAFAVIVSANVSCAQIDTSNFLSQRMNRKVFFSLRLVYVPSAEDNDDSAPLQDISADGTASSPRGSSPSSRPPTRDGPSNRQPPHATNTNRAGVPPIAAQGQPVGKRPDRSNGEGSFAVHICGRAWECRIIAEMTDELFAGNGLQPRPEGNLAARYHWAWSVALFLDRLSLMWELYSLFQSECGGDLARLEDAMGSSQAADPFLDPPQDELIGVAYLHLDGLQYLLDVSDVLPIFNFKGFRCGSVKVHARCWIDTVETIPEYISVDKETKMSEFMDHKLILRLYFESFLDLPEFICSGVYLAFRFFFHQGMYSTSRHCGIAVNPFINEAIVIEQTISHDFLEYIKTGSLELEVYGKRVALNNLIEDSRPKEAAVKAIENGLGPVSFRLKSYLAPPVVAPNLASASTSSDKNGKYVVGDPFDWVWTLSLSLVLNSGS